MLDRIKALFAPEEAVAPPPVHHDVELAAAALLVVAGEQDGLFCGEERNQVSELLARRFAHLDAGEVAELVDEAESVVSESAQILRFTRAIKDRFTPEQRIEIVEMLWEVVYADGELNDHEATLMRRVGGLVYVSDRERGEARKRVLRRLQAGSA